MPGGLKTNYALADEPYPQSRGKRLKGQKSSPIHSLRVGQYRVILTIEGNTVVIAVIEVGDRSKTDRNHRSVAKSRGQSRHAPTAFPKRRPGSLRTRTPGAGSLLPMLQHAAGAWRVNVTFCGYCLQPRTRCPRIEKNVPAAKNPPVRRRRANGQVAVRNPLRGTLRPSRHSASSTAPLICIPEPPCRPSGSRRRPATRPALR